MSERESGGGPGAGAAGRENRPARIGRLGEDIAAGYVTDAGWSVLERNWRCRYGELDIVAVDGAALVVVEVKTRTGRMYPDPAEAVTPDKLAKMRRATAIWLAGQDSWFATVRFDVIAIRLDPIEPADTARAGLRHHVGVFA
ncbi:YraN family protein [Gordonia pseudamarae]|jgi:putative endonuclease|uniref:UPF0102 protein GII31_09060 n=1 Tax=Gordonia pseudamarae TaxID=2831662 RepID=A0ABX6II28_9ACTN|nr:MULTISPECIES: YraN family protein [Gordonia]MBD0021030.1 YraN family protein [Gordonia sp. (in: high G+C Gram-positive bacteria)]QHN26129.1 YraN family protein [Gordonia pseudamarae]QHN35024.1 YraN family protein [Gordonia pseudamarae]